MQVYTIDVAGSKRVVISGYDNFHNLLVKSADYTSTRSTASMTKVIQDAARDTYTWYVCMRRSDKIFNYNYKYMSGMSVLSDVSRPTDTDSPPHSLSWFTEIPLSHNFGDSM